MIDKQHRYYRQIQLDVQRTYPISQTLTHLVSWQRQKRRDLATVLHAVFSRNPDLHYYQGFHEITSVLIRVLGVRLGFLAAERLALLFLRDAMFSGGTLEPIMVQLECIYGILERQDRELWAFLTATNRGLGKCPFYSLSWLLTWFTHNIPHERESEGAGEEAILLIFDYILASGCPLMPVYISASLLIDSRLGIMRFAGDDAELHAHLQSLPTAQLSQQDSLQRIIALSWQLYIRHPPQSNWLRGMLVNAVGEYSCCLRFEKDFSDLMEQQSAAVVDQYSSTKTLLRQRHSISDLSSASTTAVYDELAGVKEILRLQAAEWLKGKQARDDDTTRNKNNSSGLAIAVTAVSTTIALAAMAFALADQKDYQQTVNFVWGALSHLL